MKEIPNINSVYKKRQKSLLEDRKALAKKDRRMSMIRLFSFFAIIAAIIWFFQLSTWLGLLLVYPALLIFYRIIKYHETLRKELKKKNHQLDLCVAEGLALDNQFDFFRDGEEFRDDTHPYSSDLDIFGDHSLFQALNRCTSLPGEKRLAHLLEYGLAKEDLPKYTDACAYLEKKLEWRQEFYSIGRTDLNYEEKFEAFKSWLGTPRVLQIPASVRYLVPVACWFGFAMLLSYVPWHIALLAFLPNVIISVRARKKIDTIHKKLYDNEKHLLIFSESIEFLEKSDFDNRLSKELKQSLRNREKIASKVIKEATYILSQLNLRYNFFGIVLDVVTLWDHYWANRLENWKEKHGSDFVQWIDVLAEFELLNSVATYAFNNPGHAYAEFTDGKKLIGQDLKHPLIGQEDCIPNDIDLNMGGHIKIVTGSNMGGKSTYLRTCGINIVLARCGTKICGKKLILPYIRIITSMRTQDALKENTSSFYAELKRLQNVLNRVKSSPDNIFLLDEILKGTNSNDRHKGAKAIIRQLLGYHGSGFISTHDLELGEWAGGFPEQLENVCFEVEVEGDELTFDYKLRKGISKSFNATQLMRKIGIEIE